jgi:CRISPR-associated exonuclease Cas4
MKRRNRHLFDIEVPYYSGLHVNYYIVCKRKLWLFSHGISMESENENVKLGKIIDEDSFSRNTRDILIDNKIRIDFIEHGTVHEIKKSSRLNEAGKFQVLYYLYYLSLKGIHMKGELHYPRENRVETVTLDNNSVERIKEILSDIDNILCKSTPPTIDLESKPYCKKCAYYDFCYS